MIEGQTAVFSPDGQTIAAFQLGGKVQLWEVSTRSIRTNLVLDPPPRSVMALSPDGRILATTTGAWDFDNAIYLWDLVYGLRLGALVGHQESVVSVAFSPDGRTVASSSSGGILKLWHLATQQELFAIQAPRGDLMFSPDGQWLVSRSRFAATNEPIYLHAPLLENDPAGPAGFGPLSESP